MFPSNKKIVYREKISSDSINFGEYLLPIKQQRQQQKFKKYKVYLYQTMIEKQERQRCMC